MAIISAVQKSFDMASGSVGLSALFMAGLILLWYVMREKKKEVTGLFWYGLVMLIFVINPLYIILIEKKAPQLKVDNLYLWLIPTAPVLLYSLVSTIAYMKNNVKSKVQKSAFIAGLVAVFILAITTSYSGFSISFTDKFSYFDDNEEAVFHEIDQMKNYRGLDFVTIVGPEEIVEDARKYSGYFNTLYGKEMWRGSFDPQFTYSYEAWQYELYHNMSKAHNHYEEIAECSFRNGCQAIVLDRHLFNKNGVEIPESLANRYYLSFENDDYLLYLRSSAKNEDS